VPASAVNRVALRYPPGLPEFGHYMLNQVRFPLALFGGVDLHDIAAVRFQFTRTPRGVVNISDLAFTRGGA